jgi:diacylglycerol kinase
MSRLAKSFSYAWKGIVFAVKHEKNFQVEVAVAAFIIAAMLILPLSGLERALIVFSVALVLALELANTALEKVMDMLKPRVHPYVRVIKDMMAGAVLLTSLAAVAVGIAIFLPYILVLARF